jgi:hypothetical protein
MNPEPEWWALTWIDEKGAGHIFDTNDPLLVERLAVTLPETGRSAVRIIVVESIPIPEEVKARVWKGVKAATSIDLIKEATGR